MGREAIEIPAEMEEVRQQLENWRSSHAHRARIPAELWSFAVKLVGQYGLHRTARTLGLDYSKLKALSGIQTQRKPESQPSFVELVRSAADNRPECVMEFEDGRKKIRIQLRGTGAPDVITLSRLFWSSRA